MRKIVRIFLATVAGALMLGSCACVSEDSVIKEKKELASKLLEAKYDEDFDIISISGGTMGELTPGIFYATCIPMEHKDITFEAEIVEDSDCMSDSYVSTIVCKKIQDQLQELTRDSDVSGVSFYVTSRPSLTDCDNLDISVADFVQEASADFVIYVATTQEYDSTKENIRQLTSETPGLTGTIRYFENISEEQLTEFARAAKDPTTFDQKVWKYFDQKPGENEF